MRRLFLICFLLTGCGGGSGGNVFENMRDAFGGRKRAERPQVCERLSTSTTAFVREMYFAGETFVHLLLEVREGRFPGEYLTSVTRACIESDRVEVGTQIAVVLLTRLNEACTDSTLVYPQFNDPSCQ